MLSGAKHQVTIELAQSSQPLMQTDLSHPAQDDNNRMQPLSALTNATLKHIDYLLFDVDETFTTHGLMHAETYATLFALCDAGITAVPVTGRPSGWGNVMLSTWPIKASSLKTAASSRGETRKALPCKKSFTMHIAAQVTSKNYAP